MSLAATLSARSLLLQAGFGDERRQGLGFAWAIDPALAAAYAGDAGALAAARRRHLESFNVQPHAVGLPLGAAAALEARAAGGESGAAQRAVRLKDALGAALSGSADALVWGSLRPLAAALAVFVAAAGSAGARSVFVGVALGLAAFNVPTLVARVEGVRRGLAQAEAAAADVAALPVRKWIRAARLAAGALVLASAGLALRQLDGGRIAAAAAFAAGAALSRPAGGVLRLAAVAGILGAAASAAGWAP